MKRETVDFEGLRTALRQMSRGQLLMIAERAVELVAPARLGEIVGDMMRLPLLEAARSEAVSLVGEARKFHAACLRGAYYQDFDVNWKNCTEHSKGTDAFIAEFDRLIRKCVHVREEDSRHAAREAFELLFVLLHGIDEAPDRIVFFADEAGSWQIPVDWPVVLPAYFRCLAGETTGEEYAERVERSIADFCNYRRADLLAAAQQEANEEQRAALASGHG